MARYQGRHAAAAGPAAGQRRQGVGRHVRRRRVLRRGVVSAAVAALAMSALSASQAPGVSLVGANAGGDGGRSGSAARGGGPTGDGSYHTELPPLESPAPPRQQGPEVGGKAKDAAGVPATVLSAYQRAADTVRRSTPGCGLRWELLAAIGKVESGQAAGGAVDSAGTTSQPILGPVLDGKRFAEIRDTDGGRLDGDTRYDRAVGPMQFIPSTWSRWGADGNGDGRKDPHNVYDAAQAAAGYLCAGGRDVSSGSGLRQAVLGYNDSQDYLRTVLAWYEFYREGTHGVPDGKGVLPTTPGSGESSPGRGGGPSPSDGARPGGKPGAGKPSEGGKPGGGQGERPGHGSGSDDGSGDGSGGDHGGGAGGPGNGSGDGGGSGGDSGGGDGGGGSESPSPSPTPGDPASVERQGDEEMSATAGDRFAAAPRVRVADKDGRTVPDTRVRFEITGLTSARFPDDAKSVTVRTGEDGTAKAPTLTAGDLPSRFTVRATAVDEQQVDPAEFTARVKPKPLVADHLARTGDQPQAAKPGEDFPQPVTVRATNDGKPVEGLRVFARIPGLGGDAPYFKTPGQDGDGKQERLLSLKTDDNGEVQLPKLTAGSKKSEFTLRVTTLTGTRATVPLNVN